MKKFKKIYIEITNICNLKCSFCPEDKRHKEFMSLVNFNIILDSIKDYTDYIYLHVKGEPLLHPKIKEIIDLAEKYNIKVNITTNGTLLKDKINDIKDCTNLNKINISLHCEHKNPNYLEEVFNTRDKYLKDKTVIYRLWTLKDNKLDNNSQEIVDKLQSHYKLSTEIVDKIINEQNIKIDNNLYIDKDNQFIWPSESTEESDGYCFALKTQLAILVDGTVVPCCLDSEGTINLGNIFNNSLDEIIDTPRYKELKKSFEDRKLKEELCKKCTYKNRFK